jgi:Protein of unknown function (DUF1501)
MDEYVEMPTRRQILRCGCLSVPLLALRADAREHAAQARFAPAGACILLFLNGGMSHVDTFDPKPDQPAEIRGEFNVVSTSVPGLRTTEHLPGLAARMHHLTLLRSVGFDGKLGNHSPACYFMLTGKEPEGEAAILAPPRPIDHPSMGSAASRMRPTASAVPAYVMTPDVLIENAHLTPGQFAGWLGARHEAMNVRNDPNRPDFSVAALAPSTDLNDARIVARRDLLTRLETTPPDVRLAEHYNRAFELLGGGKTRKAFDIAAESDRVRERYGRHVIGQSLLLARRLVEAGVRFVNVHWPNVGGGGNWDTHSNGFNRLKNTLLPPTDRGLSALLDDLSDRDLLQRTLIVMMTEFGRAPQIGRTFQNNGGVAGRDHWSNCFTVVMAGGGLKAGIAFGSSDAKGAYPAANPLTPGDLTATVYHALGIDPATVLRDPEGKTHVLCAGRAAQEVFG